MSNWALASCGFILGGIVGASFALGLWLKHLGQAEAELLPTPHKSRILGLSRRGKFYVFYFDEPEHPGWTYDELAEVAQRPKEWL